MDDLVGFLRVAVDRPGALSSRVLICGGSGTGKTATARRVGSALESIAKNRGVKLVYAHVNCRRASGKFALVQEIVRQVVPTFPLRGYGTVELLHARAIPWEIKVSPIILLYLERLGKWSGEVF